MAVIGFEVSMGELMKYLGLVMVLLVSNLCYAQLAVLNCETASVVSDFDEITGVPNFEDVKADLFVVPSLNAKYGFRASYIQDGQKIEVLDTQYTVEPFSRRKNSDIADLVEAILPNVKLKDIKTIGTANIGVDANQDDQAGMLLTNLFASDGSLLGVVGLFGWAPAKCK